MMDMLIGAVIGAASILFAQGIQSIFRQRAYRVETLLSKYADFLALASDELSRLKSFNAGLTIGSNDETFCKELIALDNQRHEFRRQLYKLSFQISILEKDASLYEKILAFPKHQPFMMMAVPPRPGDRGYSSRHDIFEAEIKEFENMLYMLADEIRTHYSFRYGIKLEAITRLLKKGE